MTKIVGCSAAPVSCQGAIRGRGGGDGVNDAVVLLLRRRQATDVILKRFFNVKRPLFEMPHLSLA